MTSCPVISGDGGQTIRKDGWDWLFVCLFLPYFLCVSNDFDPRLRRRCVYLIQLAQPLTWLISLLIIYARQKKKNKTKKHKTTTYRKDLSICRTLAGWEMQYKSNIAIAAREKLRLKAQSTLCVLLQTTIVPQFVKTPKQLATAGCHAAHLRFTPSFHTHLSGDHAFSLISWKMLG